MTQSGSASFLPTYNAATNQYSTLPSGTPSYSSTGAINNDGMHSYYWDSENKNVQLDSSVTMTYDALGRWVERQTSSGYSQAVYSPDGREFAVMSGSSILTAYVPLPQGALASYSSSGLYAYWHPDWLGTARLTSSPSRSVIADVAFSAYGQQYQGPSVDTFFQGSGQIVEANDLRTYPARNLSAVQGRWASPDPAGMAAVDLTNPQSLNRYAFVLGNPLGLVDPSGMDCIKLDGGGTADDGAGNYTCPGSTDPDILNVFSDGTAVAVSFGAYYGTRNNSGVGSGGSPTVSTPTPAVPAPTKQQIQQACLNQFYDSGPGNAIGFVSPLQMIPGWGQEPGKNITETVAGGSAKVLVIKTIADNAGQPAVQTIFSNSAINLVGPLENLLGKAANGVIKLGERFAAPVYGYAAGLDVLAHSGCGSIARQQTGQMTLVGNAHIP